MDIRTQNLKNFLDASHSVYHAVDYIAKALNNAGYTRLDEGETWELELGGKYFLTRGGSTVLAFRVPNVTPKGFMMTASHSDRPTFKVKDHSNLVGTYTRLSVEKYGGMLMAPWLDRPLSIAGRALIETENGVESRLIDLDRDLLLIPNVAIHMNRKANDGYFWNAAVDTLPLVGSSEAAGKVQEALNEAAGGKMLGHDLFLYVREKASVWGLEEEYISAQGLDDLQCAWGCTQGFLNSSESESIPMLCVFDSEEVGSSSAQGANSQLLETTLERICLSLKLDMGALLRHSFMVSADNAHAIHPNHPEFADPANAPVINKGVVLKFNADQRYTTDGISAALFRKVCAKANVPVQTYYNRADIMGGWTLGHLSLSHVSIPTADVGLPQLGMHSCYETAGVKDSLYFEEAIAALYSSTLTVSGDQYYI